MSHAKYILEQGSELYHDNLAKLANIINMLARSTYVDADAQVEKRMVSIYRD
ncbi:MAG: hypothetical protein IKD40_03415 [Bacteroidaceae bacterium]|nr:hypothetical protein [Bacteroidaceae bacterium]